MPGFVMRDARVEIRDTGKNDTIEMRDSSCEIRIPHLVSGFSLSYELQKS